MPEQSRFDSNAAYFGTLFHEAVHSTGHKSRLDRELSKPGSFFGSEDYSKEELVAELGSAFLCGAAGIDPATLDNSAAYIDGWLKALKDDRRMLVSAGSKAQAAVDFILNGRPEPEDQPATE